MSERKIYPGLRFYNKNGTFVNLKEKPILANGKVYGSKMGKPITEEERGLNFMMFSGGILIMGA